MQLCIAHMNVFAITVRLCMFAAKDTLVQAYDREGGCLL